MNVKLDKWPTCTHTNMKTIVLQKVFISNMPGKLNQHNLVLLTDPIVIDVLCATEKKKMARKIQINQSCTGTSTQLDHRDLKMAWR